MITTPARRVLTEQIGARIYVETDNSVYRIEVTEARLWQHV